MADPTARHYTDGISRTCEYVIDWDFEGLGVAAFCGKPSSYSYPTDGGHMAMCDEHAKPHLPNFAWPIVRCSETPTTASANASSPPCPFPLPLREKP